MKTQFQAPESKRCLTDTMNNEKFGIRLVFFPNKNLIENDDAPIS